MTRLVHKLSIALQSLSMRDHSLPFLLEHCTEGAALVSEEAMSSAIGFFFFLTLSKKKIYIWFFNSATEVGAGMRTPIKGQSRQTSGSLTEPQSTNCYPAHN